MKIMLPEFRTIMFHRAIWLLNSGLFCNYILLSNMVADEISKDNSYFMKGILHKASMGGPR